MIKIPTRLFILCNIFFCTLQAQTVLNDNGNWHTVNYTGNYEDYIMPATTSYTHIEFKLFGADGGDANRNNNCGTAYGGQGSEVFVTFAIGQNSEVKIAPNDKIRFVVGQKGEDCIDSDGGGAGGGGGTAILDFGNGSNKILAVAGAGGGARIAGSGTNCKLNYGQEASLSTSGKSDKGSSSSTLNGGSDGLGGEEPKGGAPQGRAGGGAFGSGKDKEGIIYNTSGKAGNWTGGQGGDSPDLLNYSASYGGWGFGGGGAGWTEDDEGFFPAASGGGGGYSGGAGATYGRLGGGGGSFALEGIYDTYMSIPPVNATENGRIQYRFINRTDCTPDIVSVDVTEPTDCSEPNKVSINVATNGGCNSDEMFFMLLKEDDDGFQQISDTGVFVNLAKGNYQVNYNKYTQEPIKWNILDSAFFTVNVAGDNEYPTPKLKNITAYLDENGKAQVYTADLDDGSTDNCGIDRMVFATTIDGVTYTGSRLNYNCNYIGVQRPSVFVYDYAGNAILASAHITIVDALAPQVSEAFILPDSLVFNVEINTGDRVTITKEYLDIIKYFVDNCTDQENLSVNFSYLNRILTCADAGTTLTSTAKVEDTSGNKSVGIPITINVIDKSVPQVNSCPSDITITTTLGKNTAKTFYIPPTFKTACGVRLEGKLISGPASSDEIAIGEYTVLYEAENASGEKAQCSFLITVEDNEAPTGICAENGVLQTGARYRLANYVTKDDWTDNSNASSDLIITQTSGPNNNTNVFEDFSVSYTVEDSYGNIANCSFNVIVYDVPSVRTKNINKAVSYSGETVLLAPSEIDNGSSSDSSPVELLLQSNGFNVNITTNSATDNLAGNFYYEPFAFTVPTTDTYTFNTIGNNGANIVLWNAPIKENTGTFTNRPEYVDFATLDKKGNVTVGNNAFVLQAGKLYYMSITGLNPGDTFYGDLTIDKEIRGSLPVYRSLTYNCTTTSSYLERLYVVDENGLSSNRNARIKTIAEVTNICNPFTVAFQTTSNNETITIPTIGSGYDYVVDWGDGEVSVNNTASTSHKYSTANTYTVKIYGEFPRIYFSGATSASKIIEINSWGANQWASMEDAYKGCVNLEVNANDSPNLTLVSTLKGMFDGCTTLASIPSIYEWNFSGITDISNFLNGATAFNQDISGLDVSSISIMDEVLNNTNFSRENYDKLLQEWSQLTLQNNVSFSVGTTNYCVSDVARQKIIDDFNWTITDGVQSCPKVTVPNVEGKTLNDAETALNVVGLDLGNIKGVYSNTVEEGLIILQKVTADSNVDLGSEVDLVKSLGAYPLLISGVMSGHITGTVTNAVELYVTRDIPDLSAFSLGVANEGEGTDGVEFTMSGSASAGDFIYLSSRTNWFADFFGFDPNFQIGIEFMGLNGNDAIELFVQDEFNQPVLIDIYGNSNENGRSTSWNYTQSWAYRKPSSQLNTIFTENDWRIPGEGIFKDQALTTNETNLIPFPIGTYGQAYDSTPPVAICKDLFGYITEEHPTFIFDAADIDNGSYDSTGIVSRSISTNSFNCIEGGAQEVTLSIFDAAGNKSTCTATVTVTVDPIEVVCKDYTAFLDYNGNTTVSFEDVFDKVNGPCFGEGAKWYISKTAPSDDSDDFSGTLSNTNATDDFFGDGNALYYETFSFTVSETKEYALNTNFTSSGNDYLFAAIYNTPVAANSGFFASRSNLVGGYVYEAPNNYSGQLTGAGAKIQLNAGTTYYAQFLLLNKDNSSVRSTGTFTANLAEEFGDTVDSGSENVDLPKTVDFTSTDIGENKVYVVAISDNGQLDYCEANVTVKEQEPFITTWKTNNTGTSASNQISIPTHTGSAYNYVVDWGDGNIDAGITGDITHTYATEGTYTVTIKGMFPRIYFANQGDKNKLLTIEQWGEIRWKSMRGAFFGCENLNITNPNIDAPDLSGVTDLSSTFENCTNFNGDITSWETSTITNMNYLFSGAVKFNQNIGNWKTANVTTMEQTFYRALIFNQNISSWNVENVTNMLGLFQSARNFNQDLNNWNVAKVEDMTEMFNEAINFNGAITLWNPQNLTVADGMFSGATKFNQNIGGWNVGNLEDASAMFYNAIAFNQDISSWNVSKVVYMSYMFGGATKFNQPIGNWATGKVTTMNAMFEGATTFDQNLANWDLSSITDTGSSNSGMRDMFKNAALSVENYDNTLKGWRIDSNWRAGVDDIPSNIVFDAGNSKFCFAESMKTFLTNKYGWTITDSGIQECDAHTPFITTWKTDNPGVTDSNTVRIPFFSNGNIIDWGDGVIENRLINNPKHTYAVPGKYTVKIYGHINALDFENFGDPTDSQKLVEIKQWGNVTWGKLRSAFILCSNLQVTATDQPNFEGITEIDAMFSGCSSLGNTDAFSNWNVSSIQSMRYLFVNSNFNGDISNWDVSKVKDMEGMFQNNKTFNQDLGNWNISSLKIAGHMFNNTSAFSIENYDKTLIGWATLNDNETIQPNVPLSANNINYCTSELERQKLIDDYNWNIIDGFKDCPLLEEDALIMVWKTDNIGETNENTIRIPVLGGNMAIDWGDGVVQKNITTSRPTHSYANKGTYTVKIYGHINRLDFENFGDSTDNKKLLEIKQWGNVTWSSLRLAFFGCSNLQVTATDQPDFTGITDIGAMFFLCTSLGETSSFSHWNVSEITRMERMFMSANFNGDISNWNVSKVTNMIGMFQYNTAFNQDLGNWDVSLLEVAEEMFSNTGMSVDNYDKTLIGWATLVGNETLVSDVKFGGVGLEYCLGEVARNTLINDPYNWTIYDKGKATDCNQTVWEGITNTTWSESTNWSGNSTPLTTNNVLIPNTTNSPVINSGIVAEVNDLTIEALASFDISDEGSVLVNGNLQTNETITIGSSPATSGTLIVKGTANGNVTYERTGLEANKWSIIAAPVSGQSIKEFIEAPENNIRVNSTVTPKRYAVAYYDDTKAVGTKWTYYTETDIQTNTLTFEQGKGYIISRATDGSIKFTGTIETEDVSVTANGNQWNSIGNPYTAYLPININGSANFIQENFDKFSSANVGVYIWDITQNKYVAQTLVGESVSLAVGQGFFVKTTDGVSSINFKEAQRLSNPTDAKIFSRKEDYPSIQIQVTQGATTVDTNIKYMPNATEGLDPGYDVGNFGGAAFDVFTRLVSGSTSQEFTLQSLPNANYEDMVIPLGIKSKVGEEVSIRIETENLPVGIEVYIEDRLLGTETKLSHKDATYKVNFKEKIDGIGRFYIHTKSSSLDVSEAHEKPVSIYAATTKHVIIEGIYGDDFTVEVFNTLGSKMIEGAYKGTGKNSINVADLASGTYIVKLVSEKQTRTKKIIIE